MADIKTVTLVGDEEVRVDLGRKHVHIRNIGDEMIYASVKPGIVPFADGVLGIPSGAKDVLTNTDGYIYIKGTGIVQLVGSDYVNGVLSVMAGAGGTGNIDEAVALAVAKIVADAPEDFDTLKEIADWISTHSDSAAAMNSDIQTLKTTKADKTAIPTSLPANGGNAATVNNHTVNSDVPTNAVFTDTTYSEATTSESGLMSGTDKTKLESAVQTIQIGGVTQTKANGVVNVPAYPTSLPANGGNAATVNNHTVNSDVPSNAKFTDTTYSDATTSESGLMSGADKTKLESAVQTIQVNGVTQTKANGVVDITVESGGGAADTADQLATPRSIQTNLESSNAVLFDGTVDVTPGVSGILPIANGGTGNSTGYVTAGRRTNSTVGPYSTAEGSSNTASSQGSHAEGSSNTASGQCSHAEGTYNTASGQCSHAEGSGNTAGGPDSHVEGYCNKTDGFYSHAEGYETFASGFYSHAGGQGTVAVGACSFVIGQYNINRAGVATDLLDFFTVGMGAENALANAFRVHSDGTVYGGTYNSSGADYAEYFEWLDGNIENEDRRGKFVTLYGNKIAPANSNDDFVLGIVSGQPSVIGDSYDDQWKQMYLTDIFGTPIFEDIEIPDKLDEAKNVLIPAHSEHRIKLNPDYDNNQKYIPRSKRPEWSAVGMMGKLVVIDDGTCEVNGWCKPSVGGIGTKSETQTRYHVMERIDETHVRVLAL